MTTNTSANFQNGVFGMDFATVGLALQKFAEHADIPFDNIVPAKASTTLFKRLSTYQSADFALHDTVTDVQPESGRHILNTLAIEHGFDEPFSDPFNYLEIGILSIVDKKLRWYQGDAKQSTMPAAVTSHAMADTDFQAVKFTLHASNDSHFDIYRLPKFYKPVVRVAADTEHSNGVQNYMWATELPFKTKLSFDKLFEILITIITTIYSDSAPRRESSDTVATVTMPKLEHLEYVRQLEELIGSAARRHLISDAAQQLKVHVDEIGAEASAMTTIRVLRGMRPTPKENICLGDSGYLLVWFTEEASSVPICAMVVDSNAYTVTAHTDENE